MRSVCILGFAVLLTRAVLAAGSFVNFETPVVHPIALNPSHDVLAVCNLPDGRIELFRNETEGLKRIGSVPVGIDPVSVRFRTDQELWVVNFISHTVNVVDIETLGISSIISTKPRPTDVVFAGDRPRAFVAASLLNTIQIFDVISRELVTNIVVQAERPTALAVSGDGRKVYAAIKESGNHSTIIARQVASLNEFTKPGAVDDALGPYQGLNPPPNAGDSFSPKINPALGTNAPPLTSMIVRKEKDGSWRDGNGRDWAAYISGTNSYMTGRISGWDMLDHDVAIVDTSTFDLSYVDGLMTVCLDLAARPGSDEIAVIGTEARNEVRFEPNLRGIFSKVAVAFASAEPGNVTVKDLNPHLSYGVSSIPRFERNQSVGDPRAIVWNRAGARAYVAGMGSENVVVLDSSGVRLGEPVEISGGPAGLALDEARNRLFVFTPQSLASRRNHSPFGEKERDF